MRRLIVSVLFLLMLLPLTAGPAEVSNLQPRTDGNGLPADVHAGGFFQLDNVFYWYGTTSYTSVRGSAFRCYTSTNLKEWKDGGFLLNNLPEGAYYQAQMLYNAKDKRFVLWFRWCPPGGVDQLSVAFAKEPCGPYRIAKSTVKTASGADGIRDFSLFADQDGTAYLIYTTKDEQRLVEKLAPDYLQSTLGNGGTQHQGSHAGALFRRNNTYYLLVDEAFGKSERGSCVRVLTSDNPQSGFESRGLLNRYPGVNAPQLTDGILAPGLYTTLRRQRDGAFPPVQLELPADTLVHELALIQFTGNRKEQQGSQTSNLPESVHTPRFEIQYWKNGFWIPLRVTQQATTSSVYTMIQCNFESVRTRRLRLLVQRGYPADLYLNELEIRLSADKILTGIQPFIVSENIENQQSVVPGMQAGVACLQTSSGTVYCWIADLRGSSSQGVKGCDYQYWSAPLEFDPKGDIEPFRWADSWFFPLP